jgi:muramidase (phage lysozyme)
MSPNLKAFLDTIAWSEIGPKLLEISDDGYDVLVGSTVQDPHLFAPYDYHPAKMIYLPKLNVWSTAAGRYQILARYYKPYKILLGLKGFWPEDQDAIAIQMIKEQHGLEPIEEGDFATAVERVHNIWASLPGAGYNQHENRLAALQEAYEDAGGTVA